MSVQLNIRQAEDVSIVDASGRITHGEGAGALRNVLRGLASGGQKKILLNLGGVTYIDSSGLGVLVSSFATETNKGGQLKLLNLTSRVRDLLTITKLLTVFEVFDDETAATRSFVEEVAGAPGARV